MLVLLVKVLLLQQDTTQRALSVGTSLGNSPQADGQQSSPPWGGPFNGTTFFSSGTALRASAAAFLGTATNNPSPDESSLAAKR